MLQNYFDKFGHKCKINFSGPLTQILDNKSYLRKWFLTHSVLSPDYILLRSHPQSCASIRSEIRNQMLNFPNALHPFSSITFYFDSIWMILVLLWFVQKPLDIFDHIGSEPILNDFITAARVVFSCICVVDMVRRFFTGFIISHCDRDEVVLDFRRASLHYLKTYFIVDLIGGMTGFFRASLDIGSTFYIILEVISFLRVFRLGTMIQTVTNIMRFCRFNHYSTEIFTSVLFLCFVVHWVSCFSILPAIIERQFNPNAFEWYDAFLNLSSSNFKQYVICCRRSLSILCGAGYLFYLEKTRSENDMIYTMFTAVLGHILTMIIFAKVFQILNGTRNHLGKFVEMQQEISNYIKHQNLSKITQNKIKTYYDYKYKHAYFDEAELISTVPISLQHSILLHSAKTLLENITNFNNLPTPVVANILSMLSKEIVLAGDVIFRCNESANSMFFLLNGTVALYSKSGREIFHLEDGAKFGQSAVVGNSRYFETVVAIETSELLRLQSKDIFALTYYCPDLIEQMLRSSILRHEICNTMEEHFQRAYNNEVLMRNKMNEESENNQHF